MITKIGNTEIQAEHKASCHCGAVELLVRLPNGLANPTRCDCSICRRKGAVVSAVSLADVKVSKGEDKLSLYQFNTKVAKHYFCSVCGIYTHHQRRSNPQQISVNIACLEGINPFDIKNVPVADGIDHPCDR